MEYRTGSHTIYYLTYHIVWCTKYRYKIITGEVAIRAREIIKQICARYDIKIIKGSLGQEHIHTLLSIPPHLSLSQTMQNIKGASSHKLMLEFPHLKKRYWGQHLWSRGYFVTTVGNVNEKQIQEYIENQEETPKTSDEEFKIVETN